jgi:peroxiredoxin
LGSGPLVIGLSRGHWCSFCRLEVFALADLEARLRAAGATLVSITPERVQYARMLRARKGSAGRF